MADTVMIVLWILLGAVAGMIYSLKKIFSLERNIIALDKKIGALLKNVDKEEKREIRLLKKKR